MTKTKITKKDMFTGLIAEVAKGGLTVQVNKTTIPTEKLVEFLEHEIDLITRKNSGKPTQRQADNLALRDKLYELLNKPMTPTDIAKVLQPYATEDLNTQRIVPLLKGLINEGLVKRESVKGRGYYGRVGV